jgi:myo-inositol-1(or 4)-monophosphatase
MYPSHNLNFPLLMQSCLKGGVSRSRSMNIEAIIQKAGNIALEMSSEISIEEKAVGDLVTRADREVERILVEYLASHFPNDGIIGEEGSQKSGTSGRIWAIDPIDGTADYVRGLPTWSVSVGLIESDRYLEGYVCVPAQNKFYRASLGQGAFCNGKRIHTREGSFSSGEFIAMNAGTHLKLTQSLDTRICNAPSALGPCLVASGTVLGAVSLPAYVWDIAGAYAVASEAGAQFRYLDGSNFSLAQIQNRKRMPHALLCGSEAFIAYACSRISERNSNPVSPAPPLCNKESKGTASLATEK